MKQLAVSFLHINFKAKCLVINTLLAMTVACSPNKNLVENWQERPLTASGIEKDWGEISLYDTDSKFWYKVSNDSQNLYIMLKMDDEGLKRKVLTNGLKVFIDTTNHRKEKFGIHFPVKRSFSREAGTDYRERPDKERANSEQMKERLLEEMQTIELIGFNNRESNMLMIGESKIRPAITFDQYNAIIYQLALPLGYISKALNNRKIISIGFETGSNERPDAMQGGNREGMSGGMRGGSGFGGRSGGRQEGMGRSRFNGERGDFSKTSAPAKFWLKNYCISCKNKTL